MIFIFDFFCDPFSALLVGYGSGVAHISNYILQKYHNEPMMHVLLSITACFHHLGNDNPNE